MHRYEIILYWSNEDQAFIAEAPELHAMQFWIDTAGELGRPVPAPKGERLMYA